jgi:serine/threonine-protein kinase HipA
MKEVPVWVWLPGDAGATRAGTFRLDEKRESRGKFQYDTKYLRDRCCIALDPIALPLGSREITENEQNGIFGVLLDAGPDTWGMRVLELKLGHQPDALEALVHGSADGVGNIVLGDIGRLREKYELTTGLANVAEFFEQIQQNPYELPKALRAFGLEKLTTSLGGMKPKLTIEHEGALWIAKFPERNDPPHSIEREYATLLGARSLGLNACETHLHELGDGKRTLLVKRFDRVPLPNVKGQPAFGRLGYASAHTVLKLQRDNGPPEKKTYLHFSQEIQRWCSDQQHDAVEDQKELWRRIVFNVAISNVDDHPKNHGLLHTPQGWRLSPAFDLVIPAHNPDLWLSMPFCMDAEGKMSGAMNIVCLLRSIKHFGFGIAPDSYTEAMPELRRILTGVQGGWRDWMQQAGMPKQAIDARTPLFERCDKLLKELEKFEPPAPSRYEIRRAALAAKKKQP